MLDTDLVTFLRSQPEKQFRPTELRSLPEFASFSAPNIVATLSRLAQGAKIQRRNLTPTAFSNKKDWVYWSDRHD